MKSKKPSNSKSAKRQSALGVVTKVLRVRIRDKHAAHLLSQSREVNQVWNYSQDLAFKVLEREHRFISAFDIAQYTKGAAKEGLSLHSQTVQAVSEEYCTRRKQFKKCKLRWRASFGSKRSLGWIPVKAVALSYRNGQVHYQGQALSLWDSYGLKDFTLRSGNFCEDARGRWYLNATVDVKKPEPSQGKSAVGIDLGLKDFAVLSDGTKIDAQHIYRDAQPKLAAAQRARKKHRTRAIHAKVANRRKDFLHKLSTSLVKNHGAVFVGDVNASALAKTKMAKSVLDAGWSAFRTMLKYKSDHAAVWFDEVNESYSTQECSSCHARTGPKGLAGLSVRQWTCSACKTEHDRDTNAAKNILARGIALMEGSTSDTAARAKANAVAPDVRKGGRRSAPGVGHDPLNAGITVSLGR
jgi:putative transposase